MNNKEYFEAYNKGQEDERKDVIKLIKKTIDKDRIKIGSFWIKKLIEGIEG